MRPLRAGFWGIDETRAHERQLRRKRGVRFSAALAWTPVLVWTAFARAAPPHPPGPATAAQPVSPTGYRMVNAMESARRSRPKSERSLGAQKAHARSVSVLGDVEGCTRGAARATARGT